MAHVINKANTMMERFEEKMEIWAKKIF